MKETGEEPKQIIESKSLQQQKIHIFSPLSYTYPGWNAPASDPDSGEATDPQRRIPGKRKREL